MQLGTITNNGTISMTARGARAQGQDVYLWKNADNTYEYVPATGGAGGAAVSGKSAYGISGKNGTDRRTGGGASGGVGSADSPINTSGAGGNGTSYSGGTGGGALNKYSNIRKAGNGSSIGGLGGSGDPAGAGGAGGLLIISAKVFINNGTLSSNGTGTAYSFWSTGGGSGGGSINIFYKESIQKGKITANGGTSGTTYYGPRRGGNGGSGCITCGSIASGTFVKD